MKRRSCLQCGSKVRRDRLKGLFCTRRCAVAWAVEKAYANEGWCDKHEWQQHLVQYQDGVCLPCKPPRDELLSCDEPLATDFDEGTVTETCCPKCKDAQYLVPQLQLFYVEDLDDGFDDAHGRLYQQYWYCSKCGQTLHHGDINEDLYVNDEDKMYEMWEEAWKKLGVNRITVSCAGPKPSYHRVFEDVTS